MNRKQSLWWHYRLWWSDFPWLMLMVHICLVGVGVFLLTFAPYQAGRASVYWPAGGIAVAFLSCMGMFVDVGDWLGGSRW